ncbi:5-carboxymethyl-2-hydroxymuconate Delta-isomerase [Sphingomonas sp.]|uniref:5-carboxymethyl-2-hydroxymuconate Delta-isomerase n=1 Tax=Sphingomonas sp. TaxID=28214 RepID=UPI003D6D8482
MAHAVVEWTDNLAAEGFAVKPLLSLIAAAMRDADGVFPPGGIRARGIRLEDYVIADDSGQDAFVNITIRMGAGRSAEFKAAFFGGLFAEVKAHLEPVFERRYLALSMYVDEADEAGSFKHNNIHTRFRKAG